MPSRKGKGKSKQPNGTRHGTCQWCGEWVCIDSEPFVITAARNFKCGKCNDTVDWSVPPTYKHKTEFREQKKYVV